MDNAPASDKSLLERLNALKPSSVSLTSPLSSKSNPASTIERVGLPSRADALATRLKSLRNQASESNDPTWTVQNHGAEGSSPSYSVGGPGVSVKSNPGKQQTPTTFQLTDDVDPLLYTDDQTLEELLEDLRSDETWLDGVAAEEEEHQRVTSLLAELGKSGGVSDELDEKSHSRNIARQGDEDSSDEDDSDRMETDADSILARAVDEVEWEKANRTPSPAPEAMRPASGQASDGHPVDLPTVPSNLQDQMDISMTSAPTQSDVDFAASIASRMAALKLSGPRALPSAPTSAVDSLGLPQAPTFVPADRPVPGLAKRTGLTDDDEKTWCAVCLEDGAVHCLGCEAGDNIYCARCWKAMHVGPQAGYDERGHSWETFVSRPR